MAVRVIERWVTDDRRAKEAAEFLDSLVAHVALRRLLQERKVCQGQRPRSARP